MDIWDRAYLAVVKKAKTERDRERRVSAMAPQLPPAGVKRGQVVIPRARASLPDGTRNRFGCDQKNCLVGVSKND